MINNKVKEDIMLSVDSLEDELIQLLSGAIQINSITPTYPGINIEEVAGGETRVAEYFNGFMDSIGLETEIVEEEVGRGNSVGVYKGNGTGKSLIFNGHIDVVPPGPEEEWTKAGPWSGKVSEGRVWGRGAADMKGGIASALIALKALLKAGYKPKGDIIFENVAGEEQMNTEAGTGAVIKRGYKADAAIVVEPTTSRPRRLGLCPSSVGTFHMKCTIKGKEVHSSMRDELVRAGGAGEKVGVSSIDKAFIIYDGLRRLEDEWGQTKVHSLYKAGHFTINPGVITGGPRGAFIISGESTIEYSIWHAPQETREQVVKEIEDRISLYAQTDIWLKKNPPKVEWIVYWPPYDVPVDAPICKAISEAYETTIGEQIEYYGFEGNNDASFLNLAGIQAVALGPGSLRDSHCPNEYVEIGELVDAAKIYALTIADWCGIEKI